MSPTCTLFVMPPRVTTAQFSNSYRRGNLTWGAPLDQERLDFLNAEWWRSHVQYSMAVWACGPHVTYWIDHVLCAGLGQRCEMMNLYESSGHMAIGGFKVEPAHAAIGTVVLNALLSGLRVTLVLIEFYPLNRSFKQRLVAGRFSYRVSASVGQVSFRLSNERNDSALCRIVDGHLGLRNQARFKSCLLVPDEVVPIPIVLQF